MASVYRRPSSLVWQCSYYIPTADGKAQKVRKSTGTKKRKDAERVAAELEQVDKIAAGVSGDVAKKIHAVLNEAGEDALKQRLTVSKARSYLAEIVRLGTGEELKAFTIQSWSEEWLRRKSKTVAIATRKRYTASVRALLTWLGDKADKPLETLTATEVRAFQDHMQSGGRIARTVNHYVKDVGALLIAAVREGLLPSNPAGSVDALPQDDSIERKPFTQGEVSQLVEAASSQDWKGIILTAVFTGLRLKDCATLTWEKADLATGVVTVTPGKTKRKKIEVKIPMHPDLQTFLESQPSSDDPTAFVFPSLARKGTNGNKGLSNGFVEIMEAAGVSRGESHMGARKNHARGFHSLRHTFVSWLANAGVSPELRQALSGHLDGESHKIYSHHDFVSLQDSISKLQSLKDLKKQI